MQSHFEGRSLVAEREGQALSARGVALLMFAGFLLLVALYHESFRILPAGDDYTTTMEIVRGETAGQADFFKHSLSAFHYRPIKTWATWAFGSISTTAEGRVAWLRVLHLAGMAIYVVAGGLWIRLLRLSILPASVAATILFVHPVMVQAIASLDGVDTPVSCGCMWIGAWACIAYRDRMWKVVIVNLCCFAFGIGFKEATFAMVPLSVGTVFWFRSQRRWLAAAMLASAMVAASMLVLLLRSYTIVSTAGERGFGYFRFDLYQLAENAVVLTTGVMFLGNSVWVFVHRSPLVLTLLAASLLAVALLMIAGLGLRARRAKRSTGGSGFKEDVAGFPMRKWLGYFALSFLAASFPANIMYHVSEMYVPPIVLPFALLCGLAAEGWARSSVPLWRWGATAMSLVFLATSILAVREKVRGMIDVGRVADAKTREIAAMLPPGARDAKVLLGFRNAEVAPRSTYAVFRMSMYKAMQSEFLLEWVLPTQGHLVTEMLVDEPSELDAAAKDYDLALLWDESTGRFVERSRSARLQLTTGSPNPPPSPIR